ncbi:MAG: hypothetical protein OHK93_003328 [Ramalina farinacea]|uniref:Uncharacterized protein n=1 Tax=Ramalina farinacea TaxID=258253 RepID=A0AA43QVK8_9LECA|nr:hypothetical protein [Ramalina farinacea]
MQSSDDGPSGLTRRRTPSDSDDDEPAIPDTPTQRGQVTKYGHPSKQSTDTSQSNQQRQEQQQRQYCTHACLFGLTHRLPLDTQCPNIVAHRGQGTSLNHVLTQLQLVEAFREQLGHDLVTGVKKLNLNGRRGSLFRLELLSHGYVVVAKACISIFADEFRKEGQVYERLESLQGDVVPVYLGNLDMINPWIEMHYSFTHMLLMSYAGRDIQKHEGIDIERYAGPYVARCAELGVFNNDLHSGNVLWNEERRSVMFIDLGEVTLFEPPAKSAEVAEKTAILAPRRILQELEVNAAQIPDLSSEARSEKRKWVFTEEVRQEYLAKQRERKAQRFCEHMRWFCD